MALSGILKTVPWYCNGLFHYPEDDRLHFNTNPTRSYPLTLQIPSASINSLRYSFYGNTPFIWNSVLYEILSTDLNSFFAHSFVTIYLINLFVCLFCLFFVFFVVVNVCVVFVLYRSLGKIRR